MQKPTIDSERANIAWDKNNMHSSNESDKEEETHICPMTYHKENEVNNLTSKLTYNGLLCICKMFAGKSSKLKNYVYVSNSTISSLEK